MQPQRMFPRLDAEGDQTSLGKLTLQRRRQGATVGTGGVMGVPEQVKCGMAQTGLVREA